MLVFRKAWTMNSIHKKRQILLQKKQMRPLLKRPHLFWGITFGNYVSKIVSPDFSIGEQSELAELG